MSKWVTVNNIERSAADAAADILAARMRTVVQSLPLAAYEFRDDIEYVHQLRVGCRRAGAALQAFRPLAKRKAKPLRRWLKQIRRAAGPARDTDVLLERLQAESPDTPGHTYVRERLKRRRDKVQWALVDVAEIVASGRLQKRVDRCLQALCKHAAQPAAERFDNYARSALRAASKDMFRLAGVEQPTVAQLHQLRIAGKRLRYSIELFHSAFPSGLRDEVYPLVEKIQSRLGKLNDHATAQALFQQWLADLPPDERAAQLAARIVAEHASSEQIREDFLNWWTTKRVAELESHLSELTNTR